MPSDNPTVGKIRCLHHVENVQAKVKLSVKKDRLYVHCPNCGLIQPTMPDFQQYIKHNATFEQEFSMYGAAGLEYNGGGEPEPEFTPEPKAEAKKETPTATPEPEKEPMKRSFFGSMGKFLAEEG